MHDRNHQEVVIRKSEEYRDVPDEENNASDDENV